MKMTTEEKLEHLKMFVEEIRDCRDIKESKDKRYPTDLSYQDELTINAAIKFKERAWHVLADIID